MILDSNVHMRKRLVANIQMWQREQMRYNLCLVIAIAMLSEHQEVFVSLCQSHWDVAYLFFFFFVSLYFIFIASILPHVWSEWSEKVGILSLSRLISAASCLNAPFGFLWTLYYVAKFYKFDKFCLGFFFFFELYIILQNL